MTKFHLVELAENSWRFAFQMEISKLMYFEFQRFLTWIQYVYYYSKPCSLKALSVKRRQCVNKVTKF